MAGPWKHPNGIFYFRREIPLDIWAARDRLAAIGVRITGKEVRQSLHTRERRVADRAYIEVAGQYEERWSGWRNALANGPERLSERNVHAVAGQIGKDFLDQHSDNPSATPRIAIKPIEVDRLPADIERDLQALSEADQGLLRAEVERWLTTDTLEGRETLAKRWATDPRFSLLERLQQSNYGLLRQSIVAQFRPQVDDLLTRRGFGVVDTASSGEAAIRALASTLNAKASLSRMSEGDFSDPDWLTRIPAIKPPISSTGRVTFDAIIDEEVKRRSLGKDAKPMPDKTAAKYRRIAEEFAKHRGGTGSDATTIRAEELEGWKAALLKAGKVSRRTIDGNIGVVKTVVGSWGKRHFRSALSAAVAEVAMVEGVDFERKPSDLSSLRPNEAKAILLAARREVEDVRKRWLPWLCAYTGLRIGEASQLETTDFFTSEGRWFFEVSSANKRSLKNANSRRTIPVHRALLAEGFKEFVEAAPAGRLFKVGANVMISRWVRDKVGIKREELSPSHGWRHLFEDLCRRYLLTDDARTYLTGRSTGHPASLYGRTHVMMPGLWAEMEKIEPLNLEN